MLILNCVINERYYYHLTGVSTSVQHFCAAKKRRSSSCIICWRWMLSTTSVSLTTIQPRSCHIGLLYFLVEKQARLLLQRTAGLPSRALSARLILFRFPKEHWNLCSMYVPIRFVFWFRGALTFNFRITAISLRCSKVRARCSSISDCSFPFSTKI